jgi:cyclin ccl1
MDYPSSTQRLKWLYASQDALNVERERARERASQQQETGWSSTQELRLLSYYCLKLIELSRRMKLPDKVTSSACTYLRRFYVKKSCLEVDPQGIVLTCLYVAGKVEDCYVSAERVHAIGGIPEDIILKSELVLLQGLEFDLACHSVYKALLGSGQSVGSEARTKMDRLLVTDAILLHTPGQLARYCLGEGDEDGDDVRKAIDLHHAEGQRAEVSDDECTKIDKLLKAERKRLQVAGKSK